MIEFSSHILRMCRWGVSLPNAILSSSELNIFHAYGSGAIKLVSTSLFGS